MATLFDDSALYDQYIADPSALAGVLAELANATNERRRAIGFMSGPTATASDFDLDLVIDVENLLSTFRTQIAAFITTDEVPALGIAEQITTTSRYRKADWTTWADVDELLADAGYPDGWDTDYYIDNPGLWFQIRDCLRLLRYFQVRVGIIDDIGRATIRTTPFNDDNANPNTAAQNVWSDLRASSTQYGGDRVGYSMELDYDPDDDIWETGGGLLVRSADIRIHGTERFRGQVVEPWSWDWSGVLQKIAVPVTFANDIGDEMILTGPDITNTQTFFHLNEIPLGSVQTVRFTVSPVGTSHPFDVGSLSESLLNMLSARGGIFNLAVSAPNTLKQSFIWQCDAYSAFSYT